MLKKFAMMDLIFFDPDNGLEVESVSYGSKNSSKYIYWREVSQVYGTKRSVLIYQHFPRENRIEFIAKLAAALKASTRAADVYSFSTAHVVFFLASQKAHGAYFRRAVARVRETWAGRFDVRLHHS
ncbi:MAG: hypothetical protein WAM91_10515 [Candidatus Acidiferrales bacterium]